MEWKIWHKVEILDKYGRRLVYAHLRKVLVEIGQYVNQGQVIGLSGCSGGARITDDEIPYVNEKKLIR